MTWLWEFDKDPARHLCLGSAEVRFKTQILTIKFRDEAHYTNVLIFLNLLMPSKGFFLWLYVECILK